LFASCEGVLQLLQLLALLALAVVAAAVPRKSHLALAVMQGAAELNEARAVAPCGVWVVLLQCVEHFQLRMQQT
jgi:hypothetical protein